MCRLTLHRRSRSGAQGTPGNDLRLRVRTDCFRLAITNTTWQRKKAARNDSGGLQVVSPHTGQSSQLFLNHDLRSGQFLPPVARNAIIWQLTPRLASSAYDQDLTTGAQSGQSSQLVLGHRQKCSVSLAWSGGELIVTLRSRSEPQIVKYSNPYSLRCPRSAVPSIEGRENLSVCARASAGHVVRCTSVSECFVPQTTPRSINSLR